MTGLTLLTAAGGCDCATVLDLGFPKGSASGRVLRVTRRHFIETASFEDDMVHESARHALAQRKKYARWLDADDAAVVANAMLLIIGRAMNMLKSQIESQGKVFEETGGFSERLTAKRVETREKGKQAAPECPSCGKAMRRRKSAKGPFWGCSAFPECKGTRPIQEESRAGAGTH